MIDWKEVVGSQIKLGADGHSESGSFMWFYGCKNMNVIFEPQGVGNVKETLAEAKIPGMSWGEVAGSHKIELLWLIPQWGEAANHQARKLIVSWALAAAWQQEEAEDTKRAGSPAMECGHWAVYDGWIGMCLKKPSPKQGNFLVP